MQNFQHRKNFQKTEKKKKILIMKILKQRKISTKKTKNFQLLTGKFLQSLKLAKFGKIPKMIKLAKTTSEDILKLKRS